jgi:iron complex transport system substrate-binding protein
VTDRKRVLFILSLQGGRIMAGGEGTEAEGIIRLAGGENAATGFQGYKQIADEAVLTAAPDLILMMAREGDLSIADADILAHPALAETPAARNGALVRMEGMLLLGFGPRTPEAARALYDALYGQAGG